MTTHPVTCLTALMARLKPITAVRRRMACALALGWVGLLALTAPGHAGTAFTYQGRLRDGGTPATGAFDLQFKLYDAATAGTQIGSTVATNDVGVTNGLFSVSLDFGAGAFTGADRWLETAVRPGAETGAYATMSPRRLLASVPYAVQAANATTAASLSGTVPLAQLPGAVVTNNASGVQLTGTFLGSGVGLTNLAATNLAGTVPDARLSTNVALLNGSQVFLNATRFAGAVTLTNTANLLSGASLDVAGVASVDGMKIRGATVFTAPFEVTSGSWSLDQQQLVGNSSLHWAAPQWQSFTAGTNGSLAGVALYYGANDQVSDWSATLSIYEGEGTGGALLTRQTVRGDGPVKIREFPLLDPVTVTNGTQYTIVMDSDIDCRWRLGYGDYYAGGRCHFSTAYDFWFRTFLDAGTSAAALVIQAESQNVGVGEASPGFPLSFPNILGDKISLWGQSGSHYGFGIQGNLLQIHSGGASADIAFGYGESTNLTETVRFKGNGNVGIGKANPATALDVNGTVTATAFVGSASGLTNLDAADLAGTVPDARLSSNVALLDTAQTFTKANNFLGNVGVGTNAPQKRLDVAVQSTADGIRLNGVGSAAPSLQISTNGTTVGELGATATVGQYSTDATAGDFVIRSSTGKVLLQNSGYGAAIAISNNLVGIRKANPTSALDVNGTVTATAFVGNASGLTNLDAADLAGTVPDVRLSANVALLNSSQVFTASNRFPGVVTATNVANTLAGTFTGNAAGLTNLNGVNIASGTITSNQLAANSVDSDKIVNGSIAAGDLSSDAAALTMVSGGAMDSELGGISIGTTNLPGGPFQVYGDTAAVDQEQDSSNSGVSFSNPLWQSFTAGTNGTLTAVELYLGSSGSVVPWSATLRIWDGEGTANAILSTQTVHGDGNLTTRIYPLATPVSVVAGQLYTIAITPMGVRLHWRDRSGDPYAGGREGFDAAYDHWFRTYLAAASAKPALVVQPMTLNVGIGTTTPGFPLTFANVLGDKISLWGQSGAHYGLGIQGSRLQIYSDSSASDVVFGYGESSNLTETVRFKGNGNVGIGISNPSRELEVHNTGDVEIGLQSDDTGGHHWTLQSSAVSSAASSASFQVIDRTLGVSRLMITTNGNVGIGTSSPANPLQMAGGAYCSGAQWLNASDRNVKEQFTTVDPREVLAKVTALPITEWKYKSEPDGVKHLGPVAQDFHATFGLGNNDRSIGTVDESGVALAAIQGLNQKLDDAVKDKDVRIAELEKEIAELKALVASLAGQTNRSSQ